MSGMTLHTPNPITPRQHGSWAGRGLLDSLRGLAFLGLALAEAGLILALALELSFAVFVYPLLLIPPTLLAVRRLANVFSKLKVGNPTEEGVLVGQSSGAAMFAAMKLARKLRTGTIVTIFPDFGDKYLTTNLWVGWRDRMTVGNLEFSI